MFVNVGPELLPKSEVLALHCPNHVVAGGFDFEHVIYSIVEFTFASKKWVARWIWVGR